MISINGNIIQKIIENGVEIQIISVGSQIVWQASGAAPTNAATGLGVVLENLGNAAPTNAATGLGSVLEDIASGAAPTVQATGFGAVLEDIASVAARSMSLGGNNLTLFADNLTIY